MRGLQWHTCLIYLDDIIVFGSNFDEHMARVSEVLDRIQSSGLKLKPEKCHLLQTEVTFLGHLVTADGVKPNQANIAKIQQWPRPTNVTEVRQILGMCNYYRRFVKDYSLLARPLTSLTCKGHDFKWTTECQKSFECLKEALIGSDIMAFARDDGDYILDTDASDCQIAAVLSQIQDGKERVISYGSRTLNKAEKNYCITDKELLGIRHFVGYYRQYLLGRRFLVRSDHQALVWLFRLKEPKGRIARWIEILSEFDFSIEYRAGIKHGNADALSRCPNPWDCDCDKFDNLERLRCGPCKKCRKRSDDMELNKNEISEVGDPPSDPSVQDVRMVVTRSMDQDPADSVDSTTQSETMELLDWSEWVSAEDATVIRQNQQGDSAIKWIMDALLSGPRPTQFRGCITASRHHVTTGVFGTPSR